MKNSASLMNSILNSKWSEKFNFGDFLKKNLFCTVFSVLFYKVHICWPLGNICYSMMLEIAWMKNSMLQKTTFSSSKINDFKAHFEERTFLKFWNEKFEICSNLIFCSQILHRMLLARAITPKARQNSFFRKMLPYFVFFFLKLNFQHANSSMIPETNAGWSQQKLNFSKLQKWHEMSILEKTPN